MADKIKFCGLIKHKKRQKTGNKMANVSNQEVGIAQPCPQMHANALD